MPSNGRINISKRKQNPLRWQYNCWVRANSEKKMRSLEWQTGILWSCDVCDVSDGDSRNHHCFANAFKITAAIDLLGMDAVVWLVVAHWLRSFNWTSFTITTAIEANAHGIIKMHISPWNKSNCVFMVIGRCHFPWKTVSVECVCVCMYMCEWFDELQRNLLGFSAIFHHSPARSLNPHLAQKQMLENKASN